MESHGWNFTYFAIHSGVAKSTLFELEKGRTEARLNTIAAWPAPSTSPFQNCSRAFRFATGLRRKVRIELWACSRREQGNRPEPHTHIGGGLGPHC